MSLGLSGRAASRTNLIIFSLFSAWMLAFPFQGQVLYSLAEKADTEGTALAMLAILAHFIGLFF